MDVQALLRRSLAIALFALLGLPLLGTGALASQSREIEGVWSFNGGAVGIQSLANGTLQGIVVSQTTFKSCPHPVGQVMWTGMRLQLDGSYWGYHRWFHSASCEEDPELGPTAWRVLHRTPDTRYLEVCFSTPGSSQPQIAPSGVATGDTYGCVESALISELPVGGSNSGSTAAGVTLSGPKACVSESMLKIGLRDPKYNALRKVLVSVNGKQILTVRGIRRIMQGVVLKKLPSGAYKVSVLAITVLNRRLTGSATYHSCTKTSGKIKLHARKHRRRH